MTMPPFGYADGTLPRQATGVIVVDVGQVRANWRALSLLVAPAECAAVVKADAYGLGADVLIPALATEGCRTFFVATAEEAARARRLVPSAVLYVLDGLLDAAFLAGIGARPVLSNDADVARWRAHRARAGYTDYAGLQVDTGLNRLGLAPEEMLALVRGGDPTSQLGLTLLMSHMACADEAAHPMNREQRSRFLDLRRHMPAVTASLAASDGLMLGKPYHFDMVRPGYALYGGQAFDSGAAPVKPAVTVHARILQVRDIPSGQSVGYAASWRTRQTRRVATVAAGYADGVFRHASAGDGERGGAVAIEGTVCPIVGRVSMDLVTVDVSEAPHAVADPSVAGGWAELIGPTLSIETVGAQSGTIGYEVLTRLGRRFHRIHRSEGT